MTSMESASHSKTENILVVSVSSDLTLMIQRRSTNFGANCSNQGFKVPLNNLHECAPAGRISGNTPTYENLLQNVSFFSESPSQTWNLWLH